MGAGQPFAKCIALSNVNLTRRGNGAWESKPTHPIQTPTMCACFKLRRKKFGTTLKYKWGANMSLREQRIRAEIVRALTYVREGIVIDFERGCYLTEAPYTETDVAEMRSGVACIDAMISGIQPQQ